MLYRSEIMNGIRFLRHVTNPDGGIPATRPGIASGCWTSASTLESLLSSSHHDTDPRPFAHDLLGFLEATQFTIGQDKGGWPLLASGTRASTMATGHAIAALLMTQRYFGEDHALAERLSGRIEAGMRWLESAKNADGGWGVEPGAGPDGRTPRMVSTVYALRAYFAGFRTFGNSSTVREAIAWISRLVNNDGGFGGQIGLRSDPCNTARAIVAFLRSGHPGRLVQPAVKYIEQVRPRRGLWPLDTEIYVAEGAPGETVYNSNTTADVLEAYLRLGQINRHANDLINWYLRNQEEGGCWYLGANDQHVRDVATWPTSEALFVLSLATQALGETSLVLVERRYKRVRLIAVTMMTVALLELLFIILFVVDMPRLMRRAWQSIPSDLRLVMTWGLLFGILASLVAAFLYDRLRRRSGAKP